MSRVSGCLWLGVALILALVAGGVAFVTLQKATVTQARADVPTATAPVVVASHPMPIGTLLTDADLTLQTLPAGVLPAGALSEVSAASGQLTTVSLDAGEMVLAHHITTPDITGDNLAFTLPEGLVAVTLAAEDLISQLSVVETGDHVDILYSKKVVPPEEGDTAEQYTFGTLLNVTVVSVARSAVPDANEDANSENKTKGMARAYVLALNPQDALVLKFLKDSGATMDLALRNIADETDHSAQPINEQYLIDRFQLMTR